MNRLVLTLLAACTLAACANTQQKPASCTGDYARINSPDKYSASAAEEVDAAKKDTQ
jgi:hypothetical protein